MAKTLEAVVGHYLDSQQTLQIYRLTTHIR